MFGRVTPAAEAGDGRRAAVEGPRGRDDRRRRERRARAEGRRHRRGHGLGRRGDARGRAARAARRQVRDAARRRRRRPPGDRQHRALGEPLRHQDGVRDVARDRGGRSSAGSTRSCPRHLTIVSTFTIGIPGFFLALAPNSRRYIPGFIVRVLRFTHPGRHRRRAPRRSSSYGIARYGHDLVDARGAHHVRRSS